MRYLVGFLCVCALATVTLVGCGPGNGGGDGSGGSGTAGAGGSVGNGGMGGMAGAGGAAGFGGMAGTGGTGGSGGAPECESAEDCDDKNECTTDVCDTSTGLCEHTSVRDGNSCAAGRGGCYGGVCNFVPVSVTIGPNEVVFDWTTDRCDDLDLPDQPARVVRHSDGELLLFDGNFPRHYVSRGADFDSLERNCDSPVFVSADLRTPDSYENEEWLWSPYRQGSKWHALLHNEFHDVEPTCWDGLANTCWYNSITYAVSTDGARSFVKPGTPEHVIAPAPAIWTPPEPGDPSVDGWYVEGYFTPTNIVLGPDDYYYALITVFPDKGIDVRGVCTMRTDTLGDPASWRAWDGSGFNLPLTSPYVTGSTTPLCEFLPGIGRQGAQSLVYSSYIDRYVRVDEWGQWVDPQTLICGFYFSLSTDLIHWSEIQLLARADNGWCADTGPAEPPLLEPVQVGAASLIDHSDSTANFERSGRTPYLYYTRDNGGLDRDLVRVPLTFTLEE